MASLFSPIRCLGYRLPLAGLRRLDSWRRRLRDCCYRGMRAVWLLLLSRRQTGQKIRPAAQNIQRLLISHLDDKIGDALVGGYIFEHIKSQRPDVLLAVVAGPSNASLLAQQPGIDQLIVCRHSRRLLPLFRVSLIARRWRPDIYFDAATHTTMASLLMATLLPSSVYTVAWNQGSQSLYDHSIEDRCSHVAYHALVMADILAVSPCTPRYTLPSTADCRDVPALLSSVTQGRSAILLHLQGAARARRISLSRALLCLQSILRRWPDKVVILSAPPGRHAAVAKMVREQQESRLLFFPQLRSLAQLTALIGCVQAVIAPDTSVVHLAAAWGKPVLGIYHRDTLNFRLWRPLHGYFEALFLPPARYPYERVSVDRFADQELLDALDRLLVCADKTL